MELKKLITTLAKRELTVATAESASAGYLSYLLTKTPGSSKVFKGGLIVYSLESKHKFFKIPTSLLRRTHGVSKTIALILAKKIRSLYNADIGLAIVGFAGPDTHKAQKGLFFISVASSKIVYVKRLHMRGNRDQTRTRASLATLDLLYRKLLCAHS